MDAGKRPLPIPVKRRGLYLKNNQERIPKLSNLNSFRELKNWKLK